MGFLRTEANADGTVYLTSPLYRKNLHYSVQPKPKSAKAFIEQIIQYIESKHSGKTGIIYCLTQKVGIPRAISLLFSLTIYLTPTIL